jgi:type IV secretion system protein VirB1
MLDCPDLAVPREVMRHVVQVESSRNPFAIGVVGGHLARQPRSLEEALEAVQLLRAEGYNFSVGIAQVNRYNLAPYGLASYAEAFNVCANLLAGSRILRECYDRAKDWGKAFSCYYSGNFVTGFQHGYVQKVFASMQRAQASGGALSGPRIIPDGSRQNRPVREDRLPLRAPMAGDAGDSASPYPEPYAIRKYLPHTPLEVSAQAHMQAAGTLPAQPSAAHPTPAGAADASAPVQPARSAWADIPLQVVGTEGNPYQTRVILPTAPLPGEQLPLPDLRSASGASPGLRKDGSAVGVAVKGGSLLQATDAPKPSGSAAAVTPAAAEARQADASAGDQFFVF